MSRETLEALDSARLPDDAPEVLTARLAALESAYGDLLQRVRRYERERAEIRERLARLLERIDRLGFKGGR